MECIQKMIETFLYVVLSVVYIFLNAFIILDTENQHGARIFAQVSIIIVTILVTVLHTKRY